MQLFSRMYLWTRRGLALLTALVLAQQCGVRSEAAPELCPVGCYCDPAWLLNGDTTFKVECGKVDWLLKVPDWSPLQGVKGNIFLCLYTDQLPKLKREDFPSGLSVVAMKISGADRKLEADALENAGANVEWMELVFSKLELRWYFPFLAKVPKLRTLTLHFETEDPTGGEVTGAPFRGLGLKLDMLSIRGGSITGFGPQVFDGLTAEMMLFRQNRLTAFVGEALRKVAGLITVNIYRNPITQLKDGDTDGLKLTSLSISVTHLTHIADGALTGLKDTLTSLSITEGDLREIPINAVAPLRSLRKLEIIDHPIISLQQPFRGEYCLERARFGGGSNGTRLKTVGPGVFSPQGDCLESLTLYETEIQTFPNEAFRDLHKLHLLYVESSSLTRLQDGAMSGISTKKLSIAAPLETIEPGAFQDMRVHPLELTLMSTHLRRMSFFYEYKSGTFIFILVVSSELACDCELAGVRRNLRLKEIRMGDDWVSGDINGQCMLDGQEVVLQSQLLVDVFANCTNITLLDPRVNNGPRAQAMSAMTAVLSAALLVFGLALLSGIL